MSGNSTQGQEPERRERAAHSGALAIVVSSLRGGGAEQVALNLAAEFSRRGMRVDLVLVSAEGPLLEQVPHGVRIIDLGSSRARGAIRKLRAYLKRERPSSVIAVAFQNNLLAAIATLGLRKRPRLVLSVHSTASRAISGHGFLKRLWLSWGALLFYRRADAVVAVSEGAADDLSLEWGLDRRKITTIYNPVVQKSADNLGQDKADMRALNPNGWPLVVSAGRLTEAKDYPTLLAAAKIVLAKRQVRFLILGEGELRTELEQLLREYDMAEHVSFLGWKSNPYPFYAAADVFVMSSAWEGFGNALVEAMACGTPVISTDCPSGPREILQDGLWGSLVPVGNAEALAAAIIKTIDEGGVDARARAMDFTVEHAATSYSRLIEGRHESRDE